MWHVRLMRRVFGGCSNTGRQRPAHDQACDTRVCVQNIDTDQIIPAEYLTLVPSVVCSDPVARAPVERHSLAPAWLATDGGAQVVPARVPSSDMRMPGTYSWQQRMS